MRPPPTGWPRMSSAVFYENPRKAIDWLCNAFGFEVRELVEGPGGTVEHSQLVYGDGLIMVSGAGKRPNRPNAGYQQSPTDVRGANTQVLCIFVDDADAHCAKAHAAGATITSKPETVDYGEGYWIDRTYEAVDPEGHHWYFMQRQSGAKGSSDSGVAGG